MPWRKLGATKIAALIVLSLLSLLAGAWLAWKWPLGVIDYGSLSALIGAVSATDLISSSSNASTTVMTPPEPVVTHMATPEPVKAIYITACTASEKRLRARVLPLFDGTELNAIVIDAKDYTGALAYASSSLKFGSNGNGCEIIDLPDFLRELHALGIYSIARITVFQDPHYSSLHPELAVKRISSPSAVWRDKKGLSYIDPSAEPFWDYVVAYSKELHAIGFDEINYDYIRFPSDGDMTDIRYAISSSTPKAEVMRSFFAYLRSEMAETGVPLSADLFGLTTSAVGDLGIGQTLEDALVYFDYVSPMVYPSHFGYGFIGIPKPATMPYEVVKYSMDQAALKAYAASSTPSKIRPWLQAFDLGATYTPAMVRAQMQATYDAGLTSWMLWNAASVYRKDFLASSEYGTSTASLSTSTPLRNP